MTMGTSTCCMENLESRRLMSATVGFGEAEPFALDPSHQATTIYGPWASDGAGKAVRHLGYGKIAIYSQLDSATPGAGVTRDLGIPGMAGMALNSRGELAVTWSQFGVRTGSGQSEELFVRVYKIGSGNTVSPVTAAISVAKVREESEIGEFPPVGIDGNGNVTVIWSQKGTTDMDIMSRRLVRSATGSYTLQKSATVVNSVTAGSQYQPRLAVHADGKAIVGWSTYTSDTKPVPFHTQMLNATGGRIGSEVKITDLQQAWSTSLAADPSNGGFAVAWQHQREDVSASTTQRHVIRAQRFSASSAPLTGALEVTSDSADPAVRGVSKIGGVAVGSTGDVTVTYSQWRVKSQEMVVLDGEEYVYRVDRFQAVAAHLPSNGVAFASLAAGETEGHRYLYPGTTRTAKPTTGSRIEEVAPLAVRPGQVLVPFRVYPYVDGSAFEASYTYARTLVPVTHTSQSLFSQSTIAAEDDEQASVADTVLV
jgi:hypothetical protein